MKLIASMTNLLAKQIQKTCPRITDASGGKPGVQPLETHSTQSSWQFHLLEKRPVFLIAAVESHSRYCLLLPYDFVPDWENIESDFRKLWIEHLLSWMHLSDLINSENQIHAVIDQFESLPFADCIRNLDLSINGHLADIQHWYRSYIDELPAVDFNQEDAWELCCHVNQLPRKVANKRRKGDTFIPYERFLDDGLHRFAKGLCKKSLYGCRSGDFPNPYRKQVELKVVSG